MRVGTYVIANHLMGVINKEEDEYYILRDKDGELRKIRRKACHEVCSPGALAILMTNKVYSKLQK